MDQALRAEAPASRRIAVVLVHGQGEQRSMHMPAEFAEHVLGVRSSPSGDPPDPTAVWQPDDAPGLERRRRIEVRWSDPTKPQLDLYEFHWAPLLGGNRLRHFVTWFFGLFRRPASDIPRRVRPLRVAVLAIAGLLALVMLAFLYVTAAALFPVQIVTFIEEGVSPLVQFGIDGRATMAIVCLIGAVASLVALVRLSLASFFVLSVITIALCMVAPGLTDARRLVEFDTRFRGAPLAEDAAEADVPQGPPFSAWGPRIIDGAPSTPGPTLRAAGDLTALLCGADVVNWEEELLWEQLQSTTGAELNDVCAAPMAIVSPIVMARFGDSVHAIASVLIAAAVAPLWLLWREKARPFLVDIMGDSARYLDDRPENVLARHAIRDAGMDLLSSLRDTERYERIIVVSHSLGTVVAFDVLRQAWGQVCRKSRLDAADVASLQIAGAGHDVGAWQAAQHGVRGHVAHWPITDFVTLGSPLTYARLLLDGSPDKPHPALRFVAQRDIHRGVPASPPVDLAAWTKPHQLRAEDLFAATRWTNIFFADDPVGGKVTRDAEGELFGFGVRDLCYPTNKQTVGGFSHNSYWLAKSPEAPWLLRLRQVLLEP